MDSLLKTRKFKKIYKNEEYSCMNSKKALRPHIRRQEKCRVAILSRTLMEREYLWQKRQKQEQRKQKSQAEKRLREKKP